MWEGNPTSILYLYNILFISFFFTTQWRDSKWVCAKLLPMCYSVPASNMSHKLLHSLLMCVLVFFPHLSYPVVLLIWNVSLKMCFQSLEGVFAFDWLIFFPLLWALRINPGARSTLGKWHLPRPQNCSELILIKRVLREVRNSWVRLKCLMLWPDVVVHTWNPSTQGGLQTLGQPGLHGDSPSQIILFNIYITVKMNMTVTFPKVWNLCE